MSNGKGLAFQTPQIPRVNKGRETEGVFKGVFATDNSLGIPETP